MIKRNSEHLSFCGDYIRRTDPDRFFCALFMPVTWREQYFRLLAFYTEITRAVALSSSWSVAGPMAGYIRLQWWRDILEGQRDRAHELAPFIQDSLKAGFFSIDEMMQIISAREEELDGIRDWQHWDSILQRTVGQVQKTMAYLMDIKDPLVIQKIISLGSIHEIVRIARNLPAILETGRCPLPQLTIRTYNLQRSEEGIFVKEGPLNEIRNELRQRALLHLQECQDLPFLNRKELSLILPVVFAHRDLKNFSRWGRLSIKRGFGDKWAIIRTYLWGRIKFI